MEGVEPGRPDPERWEGSVVSRSLKTRLDRLEAAQRRKMRLHVLYGEDDADAERQLEAIKAAGEYQEGDRIFRLRWMTKEQAEARFRRERGWP